MLHLRPRRESCNNHCGFKNYLNNRNCNCSVKLVVLPGTNNRRSWIVYNHLVFFRKESFLWWRISDRAGRLFKGSLFFLDCLPLFPGLSTFRFLCHDHQCIPLVCNVSFCRCKKSVSENVSRTLITPFEKRLTVFDTCCCRWCQLVWTLSLGVECRSFLIILLFSSIWTLQLILFVSASTIPINFQDTVNR